MPANKRAFLFANTEKVRKSKWSRKGNAAKLSQGPAGPLLFVKFGPYELTWPVSAGGWPMLLQEYLSDTHVCWWTPVWMPATPANTPWPNACGHMRQNICRFVLSPRRSKRRYSREVRMTKTHYPIKKNAAQAQLSGIARMGGFSFFERGVALPIRVILRRPRRRDF
ncbi:MAG TPA: hypothetical protein PLE22_15380 [Acidovorax sp.]|nr:hypothetical protein [Acidovorax sp.]